MAYTRHGEMVRERVWWYDDGAVVKRYTHDIYVCMCMVQLSNSKLLMPYRCMGSRPHMHGLLSHACRYGQLRMKRHAMSTPNMGGHVL